MKILKYKVTNFRSVKDSGWINCDDVTTLVGINEAGKSNLLLALWKLNPASGGDIDILHDMPVSELSQLRSVADETSFISAEFALSKDTANKISSEVGCVAEDLTTINVTRFYDGHYCIEYANGRPTSIKKEEVKETDEEGNERIVSKDVDYANEDLEKQILEKLPKFVYYSNYGNLSTKIYMPHVIKWLNNQAVDGIEKNEDQVRTIRVLFEYVNLQPKEILELGRDPKIVAHERSRGSEPTKADIEKAEKDQEERTILLQSAAAKLTKDFREWWKQGDYNFRFVADGSYFTIWVSDKRRPSEVSLDLRSTGLQWFLSFYLVFLVESQNKHKNAILLLDEAGLTLHPLAQKDLALFFNNLSNNNQIINTTHSPFIVDTNNIDRCKVVYVDSDGYTVASDNLRQGNDALNEKSIYAVHAALGLSVSDILLQGCKSVIVEGPSDQIYLNTFKQILISNKSISPKDEIVFVPSGGVKGIKGVVSIISGKNTELPFVIVDSDKSGTDCKKSLVGGLYQNAKDRIIEVQDIVGFAYAEIEDLVPQKYIIHAFNRMMPREIEDEFEDVYKEGLPIVPQIESFAKSHEFELPQGWKVDLAKKVKVQILKHGIDAEYLDSLEKLFNTFCN